MKKLLIVSLLVVVLMLLAVSAASANGGPHGDYTATTDACAGCHRAHTAKNEKLLKQSNTHDLCMSCHGSTATGANTNVDDGVYTDNRAPSKEDATGDGSSLLGGGFVNYGGVAVTSLHETPGSNQAWGAGIGGTRGALGTIDKALDCASCHDPHGSANYRIIKEEINNVSVDVPPSDETNKNYSVATWDAKQSNVCGACHNPYQHTTNDTSTYSHDVDITSTKPTTYTDSNGDSVSVDLADNLTLVCQTCHFPHGTAAAANGFATGPGAGPTEGSALLRKDNRGVCIACHGTLDFGVAK